MSTSTPSPAPTLPTRIAWLPAGSWIVYDLANTIYAAVVTYVFTPYVKSTFGNDSYVGVATTLSMIASGLMVPVMASLCDRTGQTRLYLALFTLVCVAAMFGMAAFASSLILLIAMYVVANIAYQNALTFYNALLPSVAPPERTGLISGFGVGIGYFGTIVTIAVALGLASSGLAYRGVTVVCAALFLVLSLPCLVFVRELRVTEHRASTWSLVAEQWASIGRTLRAIRQNRTLLLFFLGSFFLIDVLNTAILFFGSLTEGLFQHLADEGRLDLIGHFTDAATFAKVLGLVLCFLAFVFGCGIGWLGDRYHPLRALRLSGWCLMLAFFGAMLSGGRSPWLYALSMCVLGAIGLAGIWTAGRQLLIVLSPPEQVGEYAGLYGITNKLSVIGSTTFALVADWSRTTVGDSFAVTPAVSLALSQRDALACQMVQLVLSIVLLYGIRVGDVKLTASKPGVGSDCV
jgi:UMF1 family MFS transporter